MGHGLGTSCQGIHSHYPHTHYPDLAAGYVFILCLVLIVVNTLLGGALSNGNRGFLPVGPLIVSKMSTIQLNGCSGRYPCAT